MDQPKPLLIFDLDETLLFATKERLSREPDVVFDEYYVYFRPGYDEIIIELVGYFDISIWSSSGDNYVAFMANAIKPKSIEFAFVWGYSRCTQKYDLDLGHHYMLKNLKKPKRKGYSLSKMLIVDNTPAKVQANYGNAIYIRDYHGSETDHELYRLKDYLIQIHNSPSYRRIEKRNW